MTQKRKFQQSIAGIAVALLVAFSSCSKDDNIEPTKEELLTYHDWKINSLAIPSVTNPSADSSVLVSCDEESRLQFSSSYTYTFANNAAGGCSNSSFAYGTGTWRYDSATDSLHITSSTIHQTWKVYELSDTLLKASYKDSISPTETRDTKIILSKL
jgi:hypothetical protein